MLGFAPLDKSEHTKRPWRIHDLTKDFEVLDVWALPTPGGEGDFTQLIDLWSTFDPGHSSPVVRALFAIRWTLGRVLGLDRPDAGLGARVETLRDRLPDDLRHTRNDFAREGAPFSPLYLVDDEFAMEIANRTVHGVLHVGWVPAGFAGSEGFHGQMTVLVRPNGALGVAYMAAIAPFRHLIVYPLMMRDIGRAWRERRSGSAPSQRGLQ